MSPDRLGRAHGGAPLAGVLRASPEDFQVIEQLGWVASGAGEHVLLRLRKRGLTTQQVAERLVRHADVKPLAVGFAGMKDKHAVTEQSFSVQLPGRDEPDWDALAADDLEVLEHARHHRKLKRGALRDNRFVLVLRELTGEMDRAEAVLAAIAARGVPNYFGEQRFGRFGDNVAQARAMFAGRRVRHQQRGILLSAARSEIFNAVLDARVRDESWDTALDGEVFCLDHSRSWFGPEAWSDTLAQRLATHDIHPSGPLWGKGDTPAAGLAAELERRTAARYPELVAGLAEAGMEQDRRALRLVPENLQWRWVAADALELTFDLPAGAYATVVVRELMGSPDAGPLPGSD